MRKVACTVLYSEVPGVHVYTVLKDSSRILLTILLLCIKPSLSFALRLVLLARSSVDDTTMSPSVFLRVLWKKYLPTAFSALIQLSLQLVYHEYLFFFLLDQAEGHPSLWAPRCAAVVFVLTLAIRPIRYRIGATPVPYQNWGPLRGPQFGVQSSDLTWTPFYYKLRGLPSACFFINSIHAITVYKGIPSVHQ